MKTVRNLWHFQDIFWFHAFCEALLLGLSLCEIIMSTLVD